MTPIALASATPLFVPRPPLATGARLEFVVRPCSLGLVLVAFEGLTAGDDTPLADAGVCAILLGDDRAALRRDLQQRFPGARLADGGDDLSALAAAVAARIDDPHAPVDLPLVMHGTTLQQAVWRRLCEVPVGSTVSYGDIAASLGLPGAARAVAQACAANPLAVVVPCHRVVRADGSLSGYRWGVVRKRALLERESVA